MFMVFSVNLPFNNHRFTLRLVAFVLLLASTAATLAQTSTAPLKDLAWSAQGNNLFFTATQDGKPVYMIRSGLPGKGAWAIYTGSLTDRVRLTYRDGQGLVDVLALDKGYRITVNTIGDERTEYRLYSANRKFIVGSVLYRGEGRRWMQGIMKSEIFTEYDALSQVTDVSQQMNAAMRTGLTSQSMHIFRWPDFGLIRSTHAQGIDDLINGFFSKSAQQTREFFGRSGNVMVTAGGIGLASFTVKLLSQSELVIGVAGAGTMAGLLPVLTVIGTGVAVGLAAEKVVDWTESQNIPGRLSDLYSRLTRKTNFSEAPPPAVPGSEANRQVAGNNGSSKQSSKDSFAEKDKFKQMLALSEQLDRTDQMDFDAAMQAAEVCRRTGNFDCADQNLDKAVNFATSKAKNRELMMQARQQVVADRRAAEEARRLEEKRQVALAEERRQVALAEAKRRQQQAAEVAQRESSDSDTFGRLLFGAVGVGIIASGKGLPTEDKARIATGFIRDISGEGQGQGLAQAERDIRASRAAATPGVAARGGSPSANAAAGSAVCPTSGLRMIASLSEIPAACSSGREENNAYSSYTEAEGATADLVCRTARDGDNVRRPGVKNVSGCFCGRKLFKFAGVTQQMTCWVFYDRN